MDRWAGQTVVCFASGPSLIHKDIHRVERSGLASIAVNTTWEKVRYCDVIYGGDLQWWRHNIDRVDIPAERWTCSRSAATGHQLKYRQNRIKSGYNSGVLAVELAAHFGAAVILLLGYDGSTRYGVHHHPDHKMTKNPTKERCLMWQKQFRQLPRLCPDAKIINCSRFTEIDCFQKMTLEDALCEHG